LFFPSRLFKIISGVFISLTSFFARTYINRSYHVIGFNKLQGLPDDFGPGSNLKELHLPGNQIVGSLPDEFFSQMSSLEMFDASHNLLTGDLPSSLGLLSNNLHTVKLTKNELTGPIPTWLPRLLKAETIDLDDNQLSGSLPTELGDFKSLKRLNLSKNKIISRLPTEMGRMSNLGELLLSDNNLSGTVPTQIGNLFLLHSLDISTTHLFANMDEALCSARPEWGVSRVLYKVDCLRDDVTCSCATECCDGEGYCCDMMTVDTVCDLIPDN
jgi:Leucine-rich repeat (LRR) protein